MNWMMMALFSGMAKSTDRGRLASYLRAERDRKEKDYAKFARVLGFGAYWLWGSLKLKADTGSGTVDAKDPTVSTTGKLNAALGGIEELYKSMPWFGMVYEGLGFLGEVVARSTSMDPELIELFMSNNSGTMSNAAPSITIGGPGGGYPQQPLWGGMQGRTIRIASPGTGQSVPMRLTANGVQIDDPNWTVRFDE